MELIQSHERAIMGQEYLLGACCSRAATGSALDHVAHGVMRLSITHETFVVAVLS